MVKCSACGRFLSVIGAASCSDCPSLYHKACVGLPERAQSPNKWKCPECVSKIPKVGNLDTPIKSATMASNHGDAAVSGYCTPESLTEKESFTTTTLNPTQSLELSLEIRLFREELQQLRKELKDFRVDISDIRGAIADCNHRMDDFDGRLLNLEKQVKVSNSHKCTETVKFEEKIHQLKEELNYRDQELLQADIEISNVPETSGENPLHTVTVIAAKIGLQLDERDIIFAERVGKKSESSPQTEGGGRGRRMVVRLSRRTLRDEFLRSARTRRGATTEGLGLETPARRFYVNERLTKKNKQLFYQVRETAKHMHWRYTWTKRGKIYARQGEGKTVHLIKSEDDLVRVFGDISVGLKKDF